MVYSTYTSKETTFNTELLRPRS